MAYEKGLILIPARYDSHRLPGKARPAGRRC